MTGPTDRRAVSTTPFTETTSAVAVKTTVMDPLLDPNSLRGRADIDFREGRSVDDRETFDYFASIEGLAAVGLTNEAGAVLLMNGPHGWRLPYGPVETDEDWAVVGGRIGEALLGVDVDVSRAERVERTIHCVEDDEERTTTSYDVVLRAVPVTGEPIADDPDFGPWDELEPDWFETVPGDAYWDHGTAVDDIRLFVP